MKEAPFPIHWPQVERHPRLVFDYIGAAEAAMIRYYIERGEPFSVVIDARDAALAEEMAAHTMDAAALAVALEDLQSEKLCHYEDAEALEEALAERDRLRAALDEVLAIEPPWSVNTVFVIRGIISAALTEGGE